MAIIGRRNILKAVRESGPGLYLDGGELGEILLPGRYIPNGFAPTDNLDVFVYRDSEDRLVATTERPFVQAGEFASLKVISVNDRVGAFLDWGLSRDLLLPFREQSHPLRAGDRAVVYVYIDEQTDRITATTRYQRHLSHEPPPFRAGQTVNALICHRTPLGYNAIIEGTHMGLLYADRLSAPLPVGKKMKVFVRTVRPDGKIDLSLDASGYKRVTSITEKIIETLQHNNGQLNADDDSPPELIRRHFGVSKKAFKQALGKLYKLRRIKFLKPGIQLLDNSSWSPSKTSRDK